MHSLPTIQRGACEMWSLHSSSQSSSPHKDHPHPHVVALHLCIRCFLLLLIGAAVFPHSAVHAQQFQFASPRVSSGLVALYTFTEGASNPASLQSVDQSGSNVLGNITLSSDPLSAAWTSGRAGLHLNGTGTQTRAVSAFNATRLISLLSNAAGLTIEVWFTPSSTAEKGMIYGFGDWTPKAHESGSCGDYDFAVYQEATNVVFDAVWNRTASQCGTATQFSALSSATFVSISLNSSHQRVIVNAASINSVVSKLDFHSWNSTALLMFSQPVFNNAGVYTSNTWAGDLFLMAIYNRTLALSDVAQNYAAGIPYSVPIPVPALTWLAAQENALPARLSTLSSSPLLLDYSNSDSSRYSTVSIAITSGPTHGLLFTYPDMTPVAGAGFAMPFAFTVGQAFAYQPPASYSGVDSFTFTPRVAVESGASGTVLILIIAPPVSADLSASVVASKQGGSQFPLCQRTSCVFRINSLSLCSV